jgi:hypothetical protein
MSFFFAVLTRILNTHTTVPPFKIHFGVGLIIDYFPKLKIHIFDDGINDANDVTVRRGVCSIISIITNVQHGSLMPTS